MKKLTSEKTGISIDAPEDWKMVETNNEITFTDDRENKINLRVMGNNKTFEELIKQIDTQANRTFKKIHDKNNLKNFRLEAVNKEKFYDPEINSRGYYYSGRVARSHRTLFTGFFMFENKVCYFRAESLNNEFNKRLIDVYEKSIKSIFIE